MNSCALFLTSAIDGMGDQRLGPAALPQERSVTHCIWPQGRSGRVRKTSPQPGFDPWTVQPVASRYTD